MRNPDWSLVQFVSDESPGIQAGIESEGVVRALPASWPQTTAAIFNEWSTLEGALKALDPGELRSVPGARLVAPITYPRKVICAGANYFDHAEEMGTARPDPNGAPFFFLKPPTTTIVGPGADVTMPGGVDPELDWEIELGVIIADRCKSVPADEAMSHVAGYVIANDISARGLFSRSDAVFPPFAWDWFGHKALDGFCPLGPGIVPAWQVPDVTDLAMTLTVNGVPKQDSNTGNLVIGIPQLIAAASRHVTLEPGDLILTGTPAGVGMPRKDFLHVGDVIVAEIDGLGRLENRIVAE